MAVPCPGKADITLHWKRGTGLIFVTADAVQGFVLLIVFVQNTVVD